MADEEHTSHAFPGETHVDVLGGWGAEWTAGDEDWRYHQFERLDDKAPGHAPEVDA